jgi:integrase
MGSIRRRPDGRWRARYRDPSGRERARHFDRRVDGERWLTTVQAEVLRGEWVDPAAGRITLREFAGGWMQTQPWRYSTRDRVESLLRRHVLPAFGDRPLSSLRSSELQAWVTRLGDRLAPSTVESVYRLLASIATAAVKDRLLARTPCDAVRLPRRAGSLLVPLTVEEVLALAAAIVPELRAAVLAAAGTGLRQGELFGLTVDRVRWLRRELVVDRQLVTPNAGEPRLGPTKTARSVRVVPLADPVLEVLSEHVDRRQDGFVFTRSDGGPWRRQRSCAAMRRAATAAGVDAGWHALRHHAASVLIAQGLGVTAVAATLGHTPAECLATYAHWWPNEDDAIRVAITRAWSMAPAAPADSSRTVGSR